MRAFLLVTTLVAACGSSTTLVPADAGAAHPDATGSTPDAEATADASATDALVDSGTATSLDACGTSVPLVPDAAPHTCALTPADVACNVDSDCTVLNVEHCGCTSQAYGVSTSADVSCPAPPCVPTLPDAGGCAVTGVVTEDCQIAPTLADVGVQCVNHQCVTDVKVGAE